MAGLTSRRKADEWIREGRISVNGLLITEPGLSVRWGEDHICVDGRAIPGPSQRLYLMFNKPFAVISALHDPEGRPVVTRYLDGVPARVYPVGRLDFDSLGLLLFTNDGQWAHRLTHPRFHVPRTYKVTIAGSLSHEGIQALTDGVQLEDGFSGKAKVTLLNRSPQKSLIRMTITSGRNRIVRRMVEASGYEVVHLLRIGFGPLELGDLKVGEYRYLEETEVVALSKPIGLS